MISHVFQPQLSCSVALQVHHWSRTQKEPCCYLRAAYVIDSNPANFSIINTELEASHVGNPTWKRGKVPDTSATYNVAYRVFSGTLFRAAELQGGLTAARPLSARDGVELPSRFRVLSRKIGAMGQAPAARACFVENLKDIRGALDGAMNHRGPALVNVVISRGFSPEAAAVPQKIIENFRLLVSMPAAPVSFGCPSIWPQSCSKVP